MQNPSRYHYPIASAAKFFYQYADNTTFDLMTENPLNILADFPVFFPLPMFTKPQSPSLLNGLLSNYEEISVLSR